MEEEFQLGRTRYGVRGTPTLMLEDGTRLHMPMATPRIRDERIVAVHEQTCLGEDCLQATRGLFEQALRQGTGSGGRS